MPFFVNLSKTRNLTYLYFYIPESFCGEHVKVFVTVLTDDFPDYIDEVFFYLGFPRSK